MTLGRPRSRRAAAAGRGPGTVTLSRAEYDRLLDLAGRTRARRTSTPRRRGADPRRHPRPRRRAIGPRDDARGRRGLPCRRGEGHADQERDAARRAHWTTGRCRSSPKPAATSRSSRARRRSRRRSRSATALSFDAGPRRVRPAGARRPAASPRRSTCPGDQTDVHLSHRAHPAPHLRRRPDDDRGDAASRERRPKCGGRRTTARRPNSPARDVRLLSEVKSIVTIGDADVRLLSLVNVTIVQGEPSQIAVTIPAGYEVVSVSGASLERTRDAGRPGRALRLGSGAAAAPVPRQPRSAGTPAARSS